MNTYLCIHTRTHTWCERELRLRRRESAALRWHGAGARGHLWQGRWTEGLGGCRCWDGGARSYGGEGTSRLP